MPALLAFAGNSLLCRMALLPPAGSPAMDPQVFTVVRLVSGALVLLPFLRRTKQSQPSLRRPFLRTAAAAGALLAYAAAFSLAYVTLPTGVGALLLFASVQLCMLGVSRLQGEVLGLRRTCGAALAFAGLCILVLPGIRDSEIEALAVEQIDGLGVTAMVLAGIAWGLYTLLGRGSSAPTRDTAWNFLVAAPCAVVVLAIASTAELLGESGASGVSVPGRGLALAAASGALCSGLGYAVWYRALRHHTAVSAALCQLTVPLLAALFAAALLAEPLTPRWAAACVAVLSGVFLGSRAGPKLDREET